MKQNQPERNLNDLASEIYPMPPEVRSPYEVKPREHHPRDFGWLLWLLFLLIFAGASLYYLFVINKYTWQDVKNVFHKSTQALSLVDTTSPTPTRTGFVSEAKTNLIKSSVQQLRLSAENFYDQYNTYVGWQGDPKLMAEAEANNVSFYIQGLSNSSYVIYSYLDDGKIFCIDRTGFAGEIISITANQTACQTVRVQST